MASSIAADSSNFASQIPIDLFVSKKHPGLTPGTIGFTDATGNILYTVQPHSSQSYKPRFFCHRVRDFTLLDTNGHPLMTVIRKEVSNSLFLLLIEIVVDHDSVCLTVGQNGCWQGFKSTTDKGLIFEAKKKSLNDGVKTQIEVSITKPLPENSTSNSTTTILHWILKGNPSQRSCTISDHNSILAQTSLMYKLHQICVGRSKFRLTVYPAEDVDRSCLIVSLVVIFIYGKK